MFHKLVFYDVYSLWFSHRLLANQSRYIHINSVRKFSALFNNSVDISVCIHFTIFFRFTFTAAPASLTHANWKRTDYTRNESSREHSLSGTKVPVNLRSQERKFPGTFVPGSEGSHWELSLRGAKIPGSEKSWYRYRVIAIGILGLLNVTY